MCGPEKLFKRLFVWKAGLVGRSRRRNSRATTTDSESGPGGEEEAAPAVFAAGELLQDPAARGNQGTRTRGAAPSCLVPSRFCASITLAHSRALPHPSARGGGTGQGGGPLATAPALGCGSTLTRPVSWGVRHARVAPPISQGGGDRPGGRAHLSTAGCGTGLRRHPDPARLVGHETRAPSSGPPANSGTGRHARDWPGSTDPPPPAWGRDGSSRPGWGWGCLARPTLHPNTDGRASTSYKTDGRT